MAYTITSNDIGSITDVEMAFGTDRLLPAWEDIPKEFKKGNIYTKLTEAIYFGTPYPVDEINLKPEYDKNNINRAVRAHLKSFGPKHEHKIAGVGYMIAQVASL